MEAHQTMVNSSQHPRITRIPTLAIPVSQPGEMLISWLLGRMTFGGRPGRIQREVYYSSLRNHSHSLHLVPFEALKLVRPARCFLLCFLVSTQRASASHPFLDFCRRYFLVLLPVPPAFALTAFPHHLCVLYSFLKLFYTSHWNSLSIVTSYPYILNLFTEFYILVIYTSVKLEKKIYVLFSLLSA